MNSLKALLFGLLLYPIGNAFSQHCSIIEVPLQEKITNSDLIIEGEVLENFSFWNEDHTNIFTSNLLRITKIWKGTTSGNTCEIITEGGTVGTEAEYLTATLSLKVGQQGIFFCQQSSSITSRRNGIAGASFWVFASLQGYIEYRDDVAIEPFHHYNSTDDAIETVQRETGKVATILGVLTNGTVSGVFRKGMKGITATPTISSFTPTTATGGTGTVLTISGSNFGTTRGTGKVEFKNADNGGSGWTQPLSTDYVSWSNTEIQVRIPTEAGTGQIRVTNSDPANVTSSSSLTISWSRLNLNVSGTDYATDFVNDNSAGGYTWSLYTGFDQNASAKAAFVRAFSSWRCSTTSNGGVNWEIGPTSTVNSIQDDGINIVRFDIGTELPAGVLGRTTLRWSVAVCTPLNVYTREIDMVFDSGTNWQLGPGNASGSQYDFESVVLHELGHAMQLGHVINSAEVMHYAVSSGQNKRTLSSNDIAGEVTVLAQSFSNNSCGPGPMTQLTGSVSSSVHICAGGSTTLLARGGNTYSWSPATGLSNPGIPNPVASPTKTTTYTVTIDNGSCFSSQKDVTVSVPSVNAGSDVNLCPGGSTQIGGYATDGQAPYSYSWTPTTGLNSSIIAMPTASPSSTTTYIVSVTDANSCAMLDTVVVNVSTLTANAGSDQTICAGGNTMLGGYAAGGFSPYTYAWSPATGLSATNIENPIANPTTTTSYILTIGDGSGCQAVDTVVVNVNALPQADAGPDKNICPFTSIQIGAPPSGQLSYSWTPTTGLDNPSISNPYASPTTTTTYILTATTQTGCSNSDTVTVTVLQNSSTTYTWTGAAGGAWNTLGSWDNPCDIPTPGSKVIIPSGTTPPTNTPSISLTSLTLDNAIGLSLSNSLSLDSGLVMQAGKITLGNFDLTISASGSITGADMSHFIITNGTGRLIQRGIGATGRSGVVLFPVGTTATQYTPAAIMNHGQDDEFSIRIVDYVRLGGMVGTVFTTHVVAKTWDVQNGGGLQPDADILFQWNAANELPSFSRMNCYVARYSGNVWVPVTTFASAIGTGPYTRNATSLNAVGLFAVGDDQSQLPVELSAFRAEAEGTAVRVIWSTETERNNFGFELQCRTEDEDWTTLTVIPGQGTSNVRHDYAFSDVTPARGKNDYRLKQIDLDGTVHLSQTVSAIVESSPKALALGQNYPNPASGETVITFTVNEPTVYSLTVYDMFGRIVQRITNGAYMRGTYNVPVDAHALPVGLYIYRLESSEASLQRILTVMR